MQVLLVDDDAQLRKAISWMLRASGFERIIEASDGEEALARLRAQELDLVVTDCQMPRMSGLTLAKALRVRGVHAPIVMLSSLNHPQVDRAAFDAGVNACVRKPLDAEKFLAAIQECLGVGTAL